MLSESKRQDVLYGNVLVSETMLAPCGEDRVGGFDFANPPWDPNNPEDMDKVSALEEEAMHALPQRTCKLSKIFLFPFTPLP